MMTATGRHAASNCMEKLAVSSPESSSRPREAGGLSARLAAL